MTDPNRRHPPDVPAPTPRECKEEERDPLRPHTPPPAMADPNFMYNPGNLWATMCPFWEYEDPLAGLPGVRYPNQVLPCSPSPTEPGSEYNDEDEHKDKETSQGRSLEDVGKDEGADDESGVRNPDFRRVR
jgi:hypothetical protein